ncbi:glycosylhydrolase-like jelly roll fold domain-containing protein [Paenibacillus sp. JJ-223]|uniref:glycosylhydrolase-like jelly roll fold domain-containing protein n=1 Tax=Paenibacillus sp. JJ-223 TaxID=2905647 RepID=UPI001F18A890|nr:glycosylhydrolase-like jelly roll fold domain-containing protein [Paenibacillus sp. JJ-223]CAH1199087.1 hypothetical protein PAECIP111890_01472 [Paenibacillus sp. JJ-223]
MNHRLQDVLDGRESNYILPFLWQHGEDEQTIRQEIARVHEAGIGAVCVESRPHPDFLGPKWWEDMNVIMDEARNRGMKVWILDDDHFPTGHAGGRVKQAPAELHRKFLAERHIDTLGPATGASLLLEPILANGKHELISAVAVQRDSINGGLCGAAVDLTEFVQDGILYWDIPAGFWRVFVISVNPDGGSKKQKHYLNPLDRDSTRILIDTVYEAFFERYREDFGQTLAGFFSDEPGFYNDPETFDFDSKPGKPGVPLPWSRDMPGLLKRSLGPDYQQQLHLLWHDAGEASSKVRYAYMNAVSQLYADHFCSQIGDWCRERGVEYIGHVLEDNNIHARLAAGAGHFFRSMWGQDMSGLDVVLWQIVPGFDELPFRWKAGETDSEFFHYGLGKLGVSLSHMDPKKKGRTMCELYGAYGWTEGLKLMKWLTDHMLVRGVNHFVPHAFTQKAFPDPDHPPHMYASGKNPQYRYYKVLNQYINRISHLISGGRHVATAAVLYHAEAEWSGESMYFHKPVKELMQHQIDCDVVPVDVLLEGASVTSGKLHIHQEDYGCLIIPYAEALPVAMIQRLAQMAEQGLPVHFIDGLPRRSSEGVQVLAELSQLASDPSVNVSSLKGLAASLIKEGLFDIRAEGDLPYLRNYHYVHDDLHVFMFFNESPHQPVQTKIHLPVSGKLYAYDGFLNRLTRVDASQDMDGGSMAEIALSPYESVVWLNGDIVEGSVEAMPCPATESTIAVELNRVWTVSTSRAEKYPHFEAWGSLKDLCSMSGPDVLPRFSGTFRYETDVEWGETSDRVLLNLGEVYETAEVWVNGEHVGVRICPPYQLDVSRFLIKGNNCLIVEVTNTLVKEQRDNLSSFAQQEPSGLLGPVQLVVFK